MDVDVVVCGQAVLLVLGVSTFNLTHCNVTIGHPESIPPIQSPNRHVSAGYAHSNDTILDPHFSARALYRTRPTGMQGAFIR